MGKTALGNTKVTFSEMIQGTWVMGNDYFGGSEDEDSIRAVKTAFDHGITSFDTAYIYGEGHAECVLGEAIKGIRNKCTVITKLWKTDMHKERAQAGLEEAMKRLKTDEIDVFFIHYPSDTVPIEETMAEMMRFKKEGKIGAIGLSNFSLEQMKEAQRYGDVDVIQPCYSLLWRFIDPDVLPYCIQQNIGVIPYSPLGQGLLTGSMKAGHVFKELDNRKTTPLFLPENFAKALEVTEHVKLTAQKYGKTPAQTAIRWVAQQEGITSPIVGARNPAQVCENAGALGWQLEEEDMQYLNQCSRKFTDQLPRYRTLFDKTIEDS